MKNNDEKWLRSAIKLSEKCTPVAYAFCVGAVIIDADGKVIETGFSRENDPHKHAEEIAIEKALQERRHLTGSTLYSSLEPCGERLSGHKTCVAWIIESKIKRVVFAAYEPSTFVKGKGEERLKAAGVDVTFIELAQELDVK